MNKFTTVLALLAAGVVTSPVYATARGIRVDNPPVDDFIQEGAPTQPISFDLSALVTGGTGSILVPTSPSGSGIDTEWYENPDESEDAVDWCLTSCGWGQIGDEQGVTGDVVAQLFLQPDPTGVQAYVYFQCDYQFTLATSTNDVNLPNTCGASKTGEADYLVDISASGGITSVAAVSEPGDAALFAVALGLLLIRGRFRRKQA
jgi:hypothetical protein